MTHPTPNSAGQPSQVSREAMEAAKTINQMAVHIANFSRDHPKAECKGMAAESTIQRAIDAATAELRKENERLKAIKTAEICGIPTTENEVRIELRAQKAERQLDEARAVVVAQRELLIRCFHHLGNEISRMSLNESADSGVQVMSNAIAKFLDKTSASYSDLTVIRADELERLRKIDK